MSSKRVKNPIEEAEVTEDNGPSNKRVKESSLIDEDSNENNNGDINTDSDSEINDEELDLLGEESENDEEDEELEDESDDNQEFLDKEVQINFTAYEPDESDFHGIKCLIQRLWLKENVDLSELSNLLIDEKTIAIVLKQENDETGDEDSESGHEEDEDNDIDDVYGITSLIPFKLYSSKDCIKQIQQLLISYIPKENAIYKQLTNNISNTVLVINERFLNLPPKISLPCYQQLVKDIDGSTDAKKIQFEYVIMVCKILKSKNEKSKEIVYINPEDELFDDVSETSFEYSVQHQCDSDVFDWNDDENLYEPYRKIILLKKHKWLSTIDSLKDNV